MKKSSLKILAIETSCDETAAAVIGEADENSKLDLRRAQIALSNSRMGETRNSKHNRNKYPVILSSIVSSQVDLHAKTGGVVPEVASRAHVESIIPVLSEALIGAKNSKLKIRISETNSNIQNTNVSNIKKLKNSDQSRRQTGLFRTSDIRISDLYPDAIEYLQQNIDYIAVTNGPGLIGSLLVGFNTAKAIAYGLDKPIVPVNHIEGHIYSAFGGEIRNPKSEILNKLKASNDKNSKQVSSFELSASNFPLISLTVSGGHTSLTLMRDHGKYETIGQTLDDAAGEAFDKVAKLLELGYPGGPIVSKLASEHRQNLEFKIQNLKSINNLQFNENCKLKIENSPEGVVFPRPILNDGTFNFSFSGLKTAVLTHVKKFTDNGLPITNNDKSMICCAFEDAVVDVLVTKTIRAVKKYQPKAVILAGGVAANKRLREVLEEEVNNYQLKTNDYQLSLLIPPINLCGDNAAMIGLAAYFHIQRGDSVNWKSIGVDSNLEL